MLELPPSHASDLTASKKILAAKQRYMSLLAPQKIVLTYWWIPKFLSAEPFDLRYGARTWRHQSFITSAFYRGSLWFKIRSIDRPFRPGFSRSLWGIYWINRKGEWRRVLLYSLTAVWMEQTASICIPGCNESRLFYPPNLRHRGFTAMYKR